MLTFLCLFASSEASNSEWQTAGHLSYNLMKGENLKAHDTKIFRRQPGLHVRHDLDLHLTLQLHEYCDKQFQFRLIENESLTVFTWNQRPVIQQGESHFYLHIDHTIPVGHYTLNISDPCSEDKDDSLHLCNVSVIFNPRHSELNQKRVRRQSGNNSAFNEEYLRNNYGYIWLEGGAIPWDYGVGSDSIVSSRNRLEQQMTTQERSSTVEYSRALSKLIGLNVLRGRWDGFYDDGVSPTQWVGSEEILSRWLQSRRPVRYAQCWVFAGILTTILRASGIPARTVTNYGSHHDRGLTDDGRAVLRQYDNIVQPDESTWNFHVWSEAWLERPDLGEPVGWNAVDATPQEPSPLQPGQPYRAGPAYVPYIQADNRMANYDNYFILAEVNAREVCPMTGELLPSENIGYAVVTKKIGMSRAIYNFRNFEEITSSYKIPSISKRDSERPVLPPPYVGCEREGGLRVNISPSNPRVGDNFTISVSEGNVSVEDTVIRMELRNYMGESLGFIRNYTGIRELEVTEEDYLSYLDRSSIFRFSVGEYNQTGDFIFHDALRITLEYARIQVDAVNNSDTITLTLTYTNPLPIPMTGVMVNVAGPGNDDYMMMAQPDIPANGIFRTTINVPCGDNDDRDVMIPVSLDSNVTQSVYGAGWSSCGDGQSNGAIAMLSGISRWQVMLITLAMVYMYL